MTSAPARLLRPACQRRRYCSTHTLHYHACLVLKRMADMPASRAHVSGLLCAVGAWKAGADKMLVLLGCQLEEIARRKYDTEAEKDALVPRLRKIAREEYLAKREEAKLDELRDSLREEKELFRSASGCHFHMRVRGDQEKGFACMGACIAVPTIPIASQWGWAALVGWCRTLCSTYAGSSIHRLRHRRAC